MTVTWIGGNFVVITTTAASGMCTLLNPAVQYVVMKDVWVCHVACDR
jgi:hypothetical protein